MKISSLYVVYNSEITMLFIEWTMTGQKKEEGRWQK